ncbi:MAG TPA: redoxin domain-containing protein [Gemmatimonadales bacterium]|nr:redoxin domain-containing protein [Gemmatimonadales bacterium]
MMKPVVLLAFSTAFAGMGALAFQSSPWASAQGMAPSPGVASAAPRPAPSWHNSSWLNTEQPLTLESLKGRVVLLNFWVYTCYNCTNTVPSLVDFDREYRDRGLTLIGIHTPEFPPYSGEHDKGNVERALRQYHIEYPVAQDNDDRTWNLYGIRFWPSFVLIDKKGRIRYEGAGEFHVGDGNYQLWQHRIEELLAES